MTADHRAEVEELLADYRRSREQLAGLHQELAGIAEVARSSDGLVQVTVGPQGVLRDLTISDSAYQRHRPAELSALIVQLATAAAQTAARKAADVLAPVLPAGTDPAGVLDGRADLEPPEPPRGVPVPPAARADDDDEDDLLDEASWLQDSVQKRVRR